MSAGMAEVIAAHGYFLGEGGGCRCGDWARDAEPSHATHVAEELTRAGYGNVQVAQAEALREVSASPGALERARRRVEDELVEWRDSGLSILGRNNGLTIRNQDGSGSGIIRFGFEDGFRIALQAEADMIDALNDPEGHALVQAIHDRKAKG